ncbi:MAG: hypothetical protein RL150_487 [Candidatus Parcubacteria bacterium]|jgi:hypothetical protein
MQDPNQVTYFAETDARNKRIPFGIKAKDRSRHMYVIGKTGMGKSTLLENLAVQDLRNGNGICFIDPHGKTADLLLEYVPESRINDVLYFAPFDTEHPVSFNVMEDVGYDKRHLVVSGLMSSFKKIWQDAWSARMEYILSNTLLALLEYPGSTLLSVNKMLADKSFREKVVANLTDASVKSFWVDEFAKYTERFAAEATPAIQNKIGQFTANPLIRNIVGQPKSSFDIRQLMDERKIVIINLSKGRIGEVNAQLLGSMLVTKIYLAAMSRADLNEAEINAAPNFYLFVDEFQSFANESFADILSEARKYKLNLTITHQYIEQMPEEVRAAVFGNVGTLVTFRVGAGDAEYLEKEFAPTFMATDIVNLGFAQIYLRLMIDGIGSQPFSARTLPPIAKGEVNYVPQIIDASRKQYARPRSEVEGEVRALLEAGREDSAAPKGEGKGAPKAGKPSGAKAVSGGAQNRDTRDGQRGGRDERPPRDERGAQEAVPRKPMIDPATSAALARELERKRLLQAEMPLDDDPDDALESISLEALAKKSKPQKQVAHDPKTVSNENRDSLKDALAKALGGAVPAQATSVQSATPVQNAAPKPVAAPVFAPSEPEVPHEISEDELRKILDVQG